MRTITFAMLALASFSGAAAAQTADQKLTMSRLAAATLLADKCPTMKVDDITVGLLLGESHLRPEDVGLTTQYGAFLGPLFARYNEQIAALGTSAACGMAALAFGPFGMTVPNLMTAKQ